MEFLGKEKDQLLSLGSELSLMSDDDLANEIKTKGSDASKTWNDLQESIQQRFFVVVYNLFFLLMKLVSLWLLSMHIFATNPSSFLAMHWYKYKDRDYNL